MRIIKTKDYNDMSLSLIHISEPVHRALKLFDSLLDEMEALMEA